MWGSGIIGSTIWGGVSGVVTVEPEPAPGFDIRVEVQGQDLGDYLSEGSLQIQDELSERSTCRFRLEDETSQLRILPGMVVVVRYQGTIKKFAGRITRVRSRKYEESAHEAFHEIEAMDWSQLADCHLVAARFTAGQTLAAIMQAILNTYSGDTNERLANDGVTWFSGNPTGPVLGAVNFDHVTVTKAYNDLCDLTGFSWKLDYDKKLRVFDRTEYSAPITLDDTHFTLYRNLDVSWDLENYRNQQDLRGGEMAASETRTEKFRGDGDTKSFTVSMKLAREMKPIILINDVPKSPTVIDVRRDDQKQENIEWFYEVGGKQISQNSDSAFTALTSSQVLTVQYRGIVPIHVRARAEDEIAAMAALDGTTGIYHEIETNEDIDDETMAVERVQGMLRRFGRTRVTTRFNTPQDGFASGQMLYVNRPALGVSGEFLVTSVTSHIVGMRQWDYEVQAVLGEGDRGWSDFWRRLADKGRPLVLRENAATVILRKLSSGVVLGGAQSMDEALAGEDEDFRSVAVFSPSCQLARQLANGSVSGPIFGYAYRP